MNSVECGLTILAILVGAAIFRVVQRYARGGLWEMPRGGVFGVEWAVKYADAEAVKK